MITHCWAHGLLQLLLTWHSGFKHLFISDVPDLSLGPSQIHSGLLSPSRGIYRLIMQNLIHNRLKLSEREIKEACSEDLKRNAFFRIHSGLPSWKSLQANNSESNVLGMEHVFHSILLCACGYETSNMNRLHWLDGSLPWTLLYGKRKVVIWLGKLKTKPEILHLMWLPH